MLDPKAFKTHFSQRIAAATKIALVTHTSPDGDAISSILGLKAWLAKYFPDKPLHLFVEGAQDALATWRWWGGIDQITVVEDLNQAVVGFDTFIAVDCSSIYTQNPNFDFNAFTQTIVIDHHIIDAHMPTYNLEYRDTTAISCAQLISTIFFEDADITPQNAQTLLRGIIFDSGQIAYIGCNNAKALLEIKRLLELGNIKQTELVTLKATQFSLPAFEVIQDLVANTKFFEFPTTGKFTGTYISDKLVEKYSEAVLKEGKELYLSMVVRKIQDYTWGFILTKSSVPGTYYLGFRALPQAVNVQKLCATYFNGGGHPTAAGGTYQSTDQPQNLATHQVLAKVVAIISTAQIEYT